MIAITRNLEQQSQNCIQRQAFCSCSQLLKNSGALQALLNMIVQSDRYYEQHQGSPQQERHRWQAANSYPMLSQNFMYEYAVLRLQVSKDAATLCLKLLDKLLLKDQISRDEIKNIRDIVASLTDSKIACRQNS